MDYPYDYFLQVMCCTHGRAMYLEQLEQRCGESYEHCDECEDKNTHFRNLHRRHQSPSFDLSGASLIKEELHHVGCSGRCWELRNVKFVVSRNLCMDLYCYPYRRFNRLKNLERKYGCHSISGNRHRSSIRRC